MYVTPSNSSSLSGGFIKVIVGSESDVTLCVHENLICASSDFFKKGTHGGWKESKERLVRLETIEEEVFQIYVHWLYRRTLPLRVDEPGQLGNTEYVQLAKAYVLGDYLRDTNFKNAVIDAIMDKTVSPLLDGRCWFPVGAVISCIYDNTLESSPARKLLVDVYTRKGMGAWLREWASVADLPKEFLFDLAVSVLDRRPQPAFDIMEDPCKYHEHTSEQKELCHKSKEGAETKK